MAYFPYEYFCGANVVIEVESQPIFEAAGISFSIRESRVPLYGYSSRHFDAMARGQVLVQGSIVVNYVHQDYLYRAIETGREFSSVIPPDVQEGIDQIYSDELKDALGNSAFVNRVTDEILANPERAFPLVSSLQDKYWPTEIPPPGVQFFPDGTSASINPHDLASSVQFRITFGERNAFNSYSGVTGMLISGIYFIGRGNAIQIDEEVIVEEYSFLGRNIHTLNTGNVRVHADFKPIPSPLDDVNFTISTISTVNNEQ